MSLQIELHRIIHVTVQEIISKAASQVNQTTACTAPRLRDKGGWSLLGNVGDSEPTKKNMNKPEEERGIGVSRRTKLGNSVIFENLIYILH